jgi:hypothetical protein
MPDTPVKRAPFWLTSIAQAINFVVRSLLVQVTRTGRAVWIRNSRIGRILSSDFVKIPKRKLLPYTCK